MLVLRLPAPEGGVLVADGGPVDVVSLAERERFNGRGARAS
jgi:hypothetical protein